MRLGQVASATKDILKLTESNSRDYIYAREFLSASGNHISSIKEIDYDVFSDTDIEALEIALRVKEQGKNLAKLLAFIPRGLPCGMKASRNKRGYKGNME